MARVGTMKDKGRAGRRGRLLAATLAALLCLQALPAAALAGAPEPSLPEASDILAEGEDASTGNGGDATGNEDVAGDGTGTEDGTENGVATDGENGAENSGDGPGEDDSDALGQPDDGDDAAPATDADGAELGAGDGRTEDASPLVEEAPRTVPVATASDAEERTASNINQLEAVFTEANTNGGSYVVTLTGNISLTYNLSLRQGEVTLVGSDSGWLTGSSSYARFNVSAGAVLNLGAADNSGGVELVLPEGGSTSSSSIFTGSGTVNLYNGTRIGPAEGYATRSSRPAFSDGITAVIWPGSTVEGLARLVSGTTAVTSFEMHGGLIQDVGTVFGDYGAFSVALHAGEIADADKVFNFGNTQGNTQITPQPISATVTVDDGFVMSNVVQLAAVELQAVNDAVSITMNGTTIEETKDLAALRSNSFYDTFAWAWVKSGSGTAANSSQVDFTMNGCTVSGVKAENSGTDTFGLFAIRQFVKFDLSDTTFEGCSGGREGALIIYDGTTQNGQYGTSAFVPMRLSGVTFRNNEVGTGGLVCVPSCSMIMGLTGMYPPSEVTIEGCTFEGNYVPDAYMGDAGKTALVKIGGIPEKLASFPIYSSRPVEGPVLVEGCTFSGNSSRGIAGALYAVDVADLTVSKCRFEKNSSHAGAGAEIKGSATNAVLTDCVFVGNVAHGDDPQASGGGALYVHDGAKVSMEGGEISDNSAEFHGGGVWLSDESTLTMEGVKVSGNTTAAHGGGVSIPYKKSEAEADSVLTMTGCTVEGNAAAEFGGGVQAMSGKVALTNCTITGNVAGSEDPDAPDADLAEGSHGGGVWAESGYGHVTADAYAESPATVTVTGGTVSGNRAGDHAGGAGASQGATLEMTGVEVTGNWAGDHGGGALSEGGSSDGTPSEVTLTDCEVTGNEALAHGGGVGAAPEGGAVTSRDGSAAPAGRLTVSGGEVAGNSAGGHGGGACAEEGAFMDLSTARVYGNSAGEWADDVNVNDGAEVLLGAAYHFNMPDGYASDGWYYDNADARWFDLIKQNPPVANLLEATDGVAYNAATGVWAITTATALKDAHGPVPDVPDTTEPDVPVADSPATGTPAGPDGTDGPGPLPAALPATGDSPAAALVGAGALLALAAAALAGRRLWRAR